MARWPSGLRRQLRVKSDPARVGTRAGLNLVLVIIFLLRGVFVGFVQGKFGQVELAAHADEVGGFVARLALKLNSPENAMLPSKAKKPCMMHHLATPNAALVSSHMVGDDR